MTPLKPGALCRNGHDHGRGRSLRYITTGACYECRFRVGARRRGRACEADSLRRVASVLFALNAALRMLHGFAAGRLTKREHDQRAAIVGAVLSDLQRT